MLAAAIVESLFYLKDTCPGKHDFEVLPQVYLSFSTLFHLLVGTSYDTLQAK